MDPVNILLWISVLVMLMLMAIVGYLVKRSLNRESEKDELNASKQPIMESAPEPTREGQNIAGAGDDAEIMDADQRVAEAFKSILEALFPSALFLVRQNEGLSGMYPIWEVIIELNNNMWVITVGDSRGVAFMRWEKKDQRYADLERMGFPEVIEMMRADFSAPHIERAVEEKTTEH